MDYSLFANSLPDQFFMGVSVGIILCAILIIAFLRRRKHAKPTQTITLVVLALIAGPLLGGGICRTAILCGAFNPVDCKYYLDVFVKVGGISGVIVAILIGLLAKPVRDNASKSAKTDDVTKSS